MAIERDVGPGGALEQQMLEQAEVLVGDALGENPGVFNFDDGSLLLENTQKWKQRLKLLLILI